MASYFDATDEDDKALLHSSVRTNAELETVATSAEADVIAAYRFPYEGDRFPSDLPNYHYIVTSRPGPYYDSAEGVVVYLAGYRPDSADSLTSALLAYALKRTIANVVSHRLREYFSSSNVKRERRGRREIEYSGEKNVEYPENWDALLAPFDLRPKFAI